MKRNITNLLESFSKHKKISYKQNDYNERFNGRGNTTNQKQ